METFKQIISHLKKDKEGLIPIRIAILGDHATQPFCKALKGAGIDTGIEFDLYEAGYDQLDAEVLNPQSGMNTFNPAYVVLACSLPKLKERFYHSSIDTRTNFAELELQHWHSWHAALHGRSVLLFNYVEEDDAVFGHFANKVPASFLYQVRKLNTSLMEFVAGETGWHIVDVKLCYQRVGEEKAVDIRNYINSAVPFDLDFLALLARDTVRIIAATTGRFKKCVIVDLDNTIWGGIIGDDGIDKIQIGGLGIGKAYSLFQDWLKELKNRGIILAVCSKNEERIALEPFYDHPDMRLTIDDIAVFMANWENKADNIRHIQSILQIGFDAMVFLDDNPVERAQVRQAIPGIEVPELPEDPAEYIGFLKGGNLFETVSYTEHDANRTAQYREEAARTASATTFNNHDEFLGSLSMEAIIEPFSGFNIPRVAQLIQRSNQFNLRTIRYTEAEVREMSASPEYHCFAVKLRDIYGDYGLVSAVILKRREHHSFFIDTWVMSCRVLKRGVEQLIFNEMIMQAIENNVTRIAGEYLPTPKNGLVQFLLKDLGFEGEGQNWILSTAGAAIKKHHIHDALRSIHAAE